MAAGDSREGLRISSPPLRSINLSRYSPVPAERPPRGNIVASADCLARKVFKMFDLTLGVPELLLPAVLIYSAVFLLLRIVGKKHVGELAPFDLVVLLILSESVQGALTAGDTSVTAGVLTAAALFGTNQLVGYVSSRSKKMERLLEGQAHNSGAQWTCFQRRARS